MTHRIGVCSWSLQASTPAELVARVRSAGLAAVQLDLNPLRAGVWDPSETRAALQAAGIEIYSGMMAADGEDYTSLDSIKRTGGVRPDERWEQTRAAAATCAALAEQLGLELVTLHAGALPERPEDPEHAKLVDRLREVVDLFAARGVTVALETGQESAATMVDLLRELDRPTLGVNFDPANMLLYGSGEPIEALTLLAPHVLQVHIKDARRATAPNTWGDEVPAGTGEVDWARFFEVLAERGLDVDLLIEREGGNERVRDVATAHDLVRRCVAPAS